MDVDVVINLRARRGSQVVAEKVQRELPHAGLHTQKPASVCRPKSFRNGVASYFHGTVLRTIPRHLRGGPIPEVEVVNTASDALTVDEHGRPVPLPGGEHGKVLYRGPTNVCA